MGCAISSGLLVIIVIAVIAIVVFFVTRKSGQSWDWDPDQISYLYDQGASKASSACKDPTSLTKALNEFVKYAFMHWNFSDVKQALETPNNFLKDIVKQLNKN